MASDRSVRFLSALGSASTSRVLNLLHIATEKAADPEHAAKPLFISPIINKSFLLKHRIGPTGLSLHQPRAWRQDHVPFDVISARAVSLFVDQRGYVDALRAAGNYNLSH